jgi:hypothetical protein
VYNKIHKIKGQAGGPRVIAVIGRSQDKNIKILSNGAGKP